MLHIYFKHDRALLTKLCQCAYHSILIFLQNVIGLQNGAPGVVLSLHTFGDYPEKFHPHIHATVSDGLFLKVGAFYAMPDVDMKPLEEIFRGKSRKNFQVIRQILKHLGLWIPAPSRDPPNTNFSTKHHEPVYEIFDDLYAFSAQADDCPGYDESCIARN